MTPRAPALPFLGRAGGTADKERPIDFSCLVGPKGPRDYLDVVARFHAPTCRECVGSTQRLGLQSYWADTTVVFMLSKLLTLCFWSEVSLVFYLFHLTVSPRSGFGSMSIDCCICVSLPSKLFLFTC